MQHAWVAGAHFGERSLTIWDLPKFDGEAIVDIQLHTERRFWRRNS
jgi:hypothetical protein